MVGNVDINQVRQYNDLLKQYRDQAAKVNAEIEFNSKELESLCKELSTELGITVTPDNLEQIYEERVAKINSTLQSGTEILNRIKMETQMGF